MWHQGLVSLRGIVLKTCRPHNNSEFLLASYNHLEEFLPETTREVFQLFKAATVLSPLSVLNFACSQTRPIKIAGIWWTTFLSKEKKSYYTFWFKVSDKEREVLFQKPQINAIFCGTISLTKGHIFFRSFFCPSREHRVASRKERNTEMN